MGRDLLGANSNPRFPDMKHGCRKPYLRIMLEMFFAETYGVDLHDSMYAERVGPPRIGLKFRCVSQIARHDSDHWVSTCRNDKGPPLPSRCEITRADIVRINRYGDGYRAYIRQRIDNSASIGQIAKELGIGKGVVMSLSRPKLPTLIRQYATATTLAPGPTRRTASR